MAKEENEAIVHRFIEEVMNGGNLEAAEDLIAPDHVNHDPTAPKSHPAPRASSS
jgi:predicted SnoaL-like aldol condensation-catalyzing enzyme